MQQDWEIKSRSHSCTRSGKPFEEGQFFYTLLFRDEAGFRREDISEESWKNRTEDAQPFSFWKTKYERPAPPPPEPLKKNDAESLLRALIESNDAKYQNAIYILALMLERKRALRPVDSADDDMLVYEVPSTGETFILRNPHLSMEQIPAVQMEVASLLDASMSAPATAPVETTTEPVPTEEAAPADEAAPAPEPTPIDEVPPEAEPVRQPEP